MIRTQIVATMGPACEQVGTLRPLLEAGVDVCRLNFAHQDLDWHGRMLGVIRQAAGQCGRKVSVLGDLAGPKIRLGKVTDSGQGGTPILAGEELVIQREPIIGQHRRVNSVFPELIAEVRVGQRILIDDGMIQLVCSDRNAGELICRCIAGGVLKSSAGVNLPETRLSIPSITARDWECVDWAMASGVDSLSLSFVRRADDVEILRQHLMKNNSRIRIIAKIEMAEAMKNLDAIIASADGIVIGRGDLGVETDPASVPILQKDIIRRCRLAGRPVVVATHMLHSMIDRPSPTRAEVSDVANAILDGADGIMLNGETAVGGHSVAAVGMMVRVAQATEPHRT